LLTRKQKPAEMNTKTKANEQRARTVSKEIRIEYEFATTMEEVQQRIRFLNLCGSCAPCARHHVGAPEASRSILNSGIPESTGLNSNRFFGPFGKS
jgi:bacterioferritin-associated ferredoxin